MTIIRVMSMTPTAHVTKTINETAIEIWLFFYFGNSWKIVIFAI